MAKVFTPADIIWFKNVTNSKKREAYLDIPDNIFPLHFPKNHKESTKKIAIDEIILIYQRVNGTQAFTHLVTPVDGVLYTDNSNPDFCHARRVKIIAKTDKDNFIPVSTTMFNNVRLSGITQGNACKLKNSSIKNLKEFQVNVWQKFSRGRLSPTSYIMHKADSYAPTHVANYANPLLLCLCSLLTFH